MRPDEWATMRSMARWVLPVLVGPRTAVTPTPRARASRFPDGANVTGISGVRDQASGTGKHISCAKRNAAVGFQMPDVGCPGPRLKIPPDFRGLARRYLFQD